jgi:hypothetical protein
MTPDQRIALVHDERDRVIARAMAAAMAGDDDAADAAWAEARRLDRDLDRMRAEDES